MATSSKQTDVLFLLFPGFNALDMMGPAEVIGSRRLDLDGTGPRFRMTIASATEVTTASENVPVQRHVSFADLLSTSENEDVQLSEYDMLVMPGGPPKNVMAAVEADHGLLEVVKVFAELHHSSQTPDQGRWLISICTGAAFLGAIGLLAGKVATTHWSFLDDLKAICANTANETGKSDTEVIRKRWVDAGANDSGPRIVTSGGVSCGIDCMLWVVSEICGLDAAKAVALGMDYDWKFSPSPVTDGYIVAAA